MRTVTLCPKTAARRLTAACATKLLPLLLLLTLPAAVQAQLSRCDSEMQNVSSKGGCITGRELR
jgi:hypothetical protein